MVRPVSIASQINYQISGNEQGKKLVFLHGVMGSLANWSRVKPAFEANHHVLVLDQRGHGHSFHPTDSYTYEAYASDLHQLLQELGWGSIRLVGHSMGARVALVFCDVYPSRVERVVIEDITPAINISAGQQIKAWVTGVPVPFSSRKAAKDYLFGEAFARQFATPEQTTAMANFFYMNIEETPQGANWRFSLHGILQTIDEGLRVDRWAEWKRLKIPSLVIRGERSPDLPRVDYERMLKSNPHTRGAEIQDSGHWVHFDQPERFKALVQEFMNAEL